LKQDNSSYNQIIKSTTIFGGSQVFVIIIGLIRIKIIALLLGTAGVGIIGIYQSITEMIRSGCMLGMDTAGVKEIAEANSSEDKNTFYKTVARFNKWFRLSALLSLLICIIFSYPLSLWAFDDGSHTVYIALLSLCAFFLVLATGKSTILQGMRKISEMAKSAIIASLIGLIITIPLYYFLRLDGIIPALIASGIIWWICAEYYYRKQQVKKVDISTKEVFGNGIQTFRLGIYIVVAGFIGTLSVFAVKAFISRNIDIDAAGLFQSSWVITTVYLGLILKAMGTDFFPRLSAIANEKDKVRTLVNEQSYIVLVVASPVIVGMLLFSGFALSLLYSSEFVYAEAVLRWQVLGTFLKVISWPIAFILLAKNKGFIFLLTEVIFYVAYLLSAYLLYSRYGLEASGIGYLVAYVVYVPVVAYTVYHISGFKWNRDVVMMILVNTVLISATFYLAHFYTGNSMLWSLIILLISLIYAYLRLKKVFSLEDFRNWFKRK